jgi:hypothetical protein
MQRVIVASCAALLGGACANIDDKDWKPRAERHYVTGSNLPQDRDSSGRRVSNMSTEETDELLRARPAGVQSGAGR